MKQIQLWIEAQGQQIRLKAIGAVNALYARCEICQADSYLDAASHKPIQICEHYSGLAHVPPDNHQFLKFARTLRNPKRHLDYLPNIPVPVILLEALDFTLQDGNRYLGLYWLSAGDTFMVTDGMQISQSHWPIWDAYIHHPAVRPHVAPYQFGSADVPASHMLVLDTARLEAYAGDYHLAQAILVDQHYALGPNPIVYTLADLRQRQQIREAARGAFDPGSKASGFIERLHQEDSEAVSTALRRLNMLETRLVQELNRSLRP